MDLGLVRANCYARATLAKKCLCYQTLYIHLHQPIPVYDMLTCYVCGARTLNGCILTMQNKLAPGLATIWHQCTGSAFKEMAALPIDKPRQGPLQALNLVVMLRIHAAC